MSLLEVTVHVNRAGPHRLETDVSTVETCEPFVLRITGHETPAHVHCRLDDQLRQVASIEGSNYYVEPDGATPVRVSVDASGLDEPIEGRLELVSGYGTESIAISVIVTPEPQHVPVDESLATPAQTESTQPAADRTGWPEALPTLDTGTLAVIVLGVLSIGVAVATAATVGAPIAVVGVGIVVIGVVAAIAFLLW